MSCAWECCEWELYLCLSRQLFIKQVSFNLLYFEQNQSRAIKIGTEITENTDITFYLFQHTIHPIFGVYFDHINTSITKSAAPSLVIPGQKGNSPNIIIASRITYLLRYLKSIISNKSLIHTSPKLWKAIGNFISAHNLQWETR